MPTNVLCRGRMYSEQDGSWKGMHGRSPPYMDRNAGTVQHNTSFETASPCSSFGFSSCRLEPFERSSKYGLHVSRNCSRSMSRDCDATLPFLNGLNQSAMKTTNTERSRSIQTSKRSRSRTVERNTRRSRSSSCGRTRRGARQRNKVNTGATLIDERPQRNIGRDGAHWNPDGYVGRFQHRGSNCRNGAPKIRGGGFGIRGRGRRGDASWWTRELGERKNASSHSPSLDPEEDIRRSRSREKARRRRQVRINVCRIITDS